MCLLINQPDCLYTKKLYSSMLHTSSSKLVIFMRLQQDQLREAGLQQLRTNQLPKSKQENLQLGGGTPDIDSCQLLDHHTKHTYYIIGLYMAKHLIAMVSSGLPQIMSCMLLVYSVISFFSDVFKSVSITYQSCTTHTRSS